MELREDCEGLGFSNQTGNTNAPVFVEWFGPRRAAFARRHIEKRGAPCFYTGSTGFLSLEQDGSGEDMKETCRAPALRLRASSREPIPPRSLAFASSLVCHCMFSWTPAPPRFRGTMSSTTSAAVRPGARPQTSPRRSAARSRGLVGR